MSAGAMWKRLLWREYREGRAALLLGLVIPPLMLRPMPLYESHGLRDAARLAGAVGVHLVILFWAVARGDNKRKSADFDLAHLPISPMAALTASFVVPALASAAVGAAFGWWAGEDRGYVLAGAIDVMTTYVFGYYFSAVVSRWLGALIGVAAIVAGKLIPVDTLRITRDIDATVVAASCVIGASVGLYVFTRLIGKKPLAYRQAVSLGMLAFFGVFPGLWTFNPKVFHWTLGIAERAPYSLSAARYLDPQTRAAVYAYPTYHPSGRVLPGNTTVLFQREACGPYIPYSAPHGSVAVELDGMLKTIGVRDRRYVYLAQQFPESSIVRIIVWDTPGWHRRGTVRELARFEACKLAIGSERGLDAISPDGAYALVTLNALVGDGEDNWIANLKTGKAAVFRPAARGKPTDVYGWGGKVAWTREHVLIAAALPIVVDLRSLSVVPFTIPLPKGGAR